MTTVQGHITYQQQECYNPEVDGHINFKLGGNYRPGGSMRVVHFLGQ